jgi:hypothetical protein
MARRRITEEFTGKDISNIFGSLGFEEVVPPCRAKARLCPT